MRVIGIDPGLRNMGWGLIDVKQSRITHVANGICRSKGIDLSERLFDPIKYSEKCNFLIGKFIKPYFSNSWNISFLWKVISTINAFIDLRMFVAPSKTSNSAPSTSIFKKVG